MHPMFETPEAIDVTARFITTLTECNLPSLAWPFFEYLTNHFALKYENADEHREGWRFDIDSECIYSITPRGVIAKVVIPSPAKETRFSEVSNIVEKLREIGDDYKKLGIESIWIPPELDKGHIPSLFEKTIFGE